MFDIYWYIYSVFSSEYISGIARVDILQVHSPKISKILYVFNDPMEIQNKTFDYRQPSAFELY